MIQNPPLPATTPQGDDESPLPTSAGRRKQLLLAVKIVGIAIALVAIYYCVHVLVSQWASIKDSIAQANLGLLIAGFALGAVAVWLLCFLWWRCLAVFGARRGIVETTGWYFGGELGKYLPGGIWPVVGRGELARRHGVPRSIGYATTLFSLLLMCVGGAFVGGLLTLFFAFSGGRIGWEMLLLVLIPIGVIGVHPAVLGRVLALARKLTKGKLDLATPPWGVMLGLIAAAVPGWIFVGAQAVVVTAAFGFDQQPSRVAFAAVVAWVIGFLAIPVPAGAGIRETLFVLASGLIIGGDTAHAVVVAVTCRVFLILVDAIGGTIGLAMQRRRAGAAADTGAAATG